MKEDVIEFDACIEYLMHLMYKVLYVMHAVILRDDVYCENFTSLTKHMSNAHQN